MASQNAVLFEDQIIPSTIDPDAGGDSDVVCLDGANKFSCQAVYTVDTPVGATVTFQASNDQVNWTNIQSATSISGNGSTFLEVANVSYRYFKAVKAISSGEVDLECYTLVIGDAI